MMPVENHKQGDALFYWLTQVCEKRSLIMEPVLQEKGMSLNKVMGRDQNFAASLEWLDQWKKNSIEFGKSEKLSADPTQMEWLKGKFLDTVKKEVLTPE